MKQLEMRRKEEYMIKQECLVMNKNKREVLLKEDLEDLIKVLVVLKISMINLEEHNKDTIWEVIHMEVFLKNSKSFSVVARKEVEQGLNDNNNSRVKIFK